MAIFDPQNAPSDTSVAEFPMFGKNSISLLHNHYGLQKPALTLDGQETVKLPIINSEVHSESVGSLIVKKPKESISSQLSKLK